MATLGGGPGGGGHGLIGSFTDLGTSITIAAQAAADLAPKIVSVVDATARLAAAKKQLATDTQFAAEQEAKHARALGDSSTAMIKNEADAAKWGASLGSMSKATAEATISLSGLSDKFKEVASAALAATDAFGAVAGGLTNVSAAASPAQAGLAGVAWEMVHATEPTVTMTAAQNALIESLAKVSDAGGASSLWVGHLIAQLKNGEISFDDFRKQVNATLQGLTVFGSVMGNTASELNAINTLLSSFKNNAAGGWPGSTTAPYSNSSSPLTGKP